MRAAARCAIGVRQAEGSDIDLAAGAAITALGGVTTHLYDLDLLTDLAAAMTRSGATPVSDPFEPITSVLDLLDHPDGFDFDLAWARLSAALAGDDFDSIATEAARFAQLGEPPEQLHHVAARHSAASVLVAACNEDAAPDAVAAAGRALAEQGATHEAARLCGVLALRMRSESDSRRLLKESRTWRAERAYLKRTPGVDRSVLRLSGQEVLVAQMVLDGHTHKQIGSTLFISAKTVEHHVAHIRTKLGAASRGRSPGGDPHLPRHGVTRCYSAGSKPS